MKALVQVGYKLMIMLGKMMERNATKSIGLEEIGRVHLKVMTAVNIKASTEGSIKAPESTIV